MTSFTKGTQSKKSAGQTGLNLPLHSLAGSKREEVASGAQEKQEALLRELTKTVFLTVFIYEGKSYVWCAVSGMIDNTWKAYSLQYMDFNLNSECLVFERLA